MKFKIIIKNSNQYEVYSIVQPIIYNKRQEKNIIGKSDNIDKMVGYIEKAEGKWHFNSSDDLFWSTEELSEIIRIINSIK